ncbi:hypothetical protein COT72_04705 [archaeon CG10_big_fil_rev_8_21_14_0_10_43_11]|nr:MAG: hypothetical protein COT72_04705 [archaeon CG10_big_fil_rev_8_21_14_0_10_43_11]
MGVIVVSGKPGAGSSTLAKSLAELLGYTYVSPGQIFKGLGNGSLQTSEYYPVFARVASLHGFNIPKKKKNGASEADAVHDVWESGLGQSPLLHTIIDQTQEYLAKQGNAVFDGKLSIRMLGQYAKMSVWLDASDETRIYRTVKRDGVSVEKAQDIIFGREKKERETWKRQYGFDYFDLAKEANVYIKTDTLLPSDVFYYACTVLPQHL